MKTKTENLRPEYKLMIAELLKLQGKERSGLKYFFNPQVFSCRKAHLQTIQNEDPSLETLLDAKTKLNVSMGSSFTELPYSNYKT